MDITVNGKIIQIPEIFSLEQLVLQLDIPRAGTAIAVGTAVVTQSQWSDFALSEGNKVTIIRATQGG